MNISCFLISNGGFKQVALPENLVLELAKSLRENGKELVHFSKGEPILVDGLFIPAKGCRYNLMLIPEDDE